MPTRRSILLFGGGVAGTAGFIGSQAVSQLSADRGVTITLEQDSKAVVQIEPNPDVLPVYEDAADNELRINDDKFRGNDTAYADAGFNVDGEWQLGMTAGSFGGIDEVTTPAFTITNNYQRPYDLEVELRNLDTASGTFRLILDPENGSPVGGNADATFGINDIKPGETVEAAIELDTDASASPTDFDGEIIFRVKPAEPQTLTGNIIYKRNPTFPIEDALVMAVDENTGDIIRDYGGQPVTTRSDDNGNYELNIPNDTVDVATVVVVVGDEEYTGETFDSPFTVPGTDIPFFASAQRRVDPNNPDASLEFKFREDEDVEGEGGRRSIDGQSVAWAYRVAGMDDTDAVEQWWTIGTIEQLQKTDMMGNENEDFRLVRDIDAKKTEDWHGGDGFEPLGTSGGFASTLTGTLDGYGRRLSNLYIDRAGDAGLLIEIQATSIKNITFVEPFVRDTENNDAGVIGPQDTFADTELTNITVQGGEVRGGGAFVGGLVGKWGRGSDSTVTDCSTSCKVVGVGRVGGLFGRFDSAAGIENCSASGNVSNQDNNDKVGGIIGQLADGAVKNCSASGNVDSGGSAGGLVGGTRNSNYEIVDCHATGDVSARNAGGLIGFYNGRMENCYATGDVTAESLAGGLAGRASGDVIRCHATGSVTTTDPGKAAGGLIGRYHNNEVRECYATGPVETVVADAGGLIGSLAINRGDVIECFAKGDVTVTGDSRAGAGGLIGSNGKFDAIGLVKNCWAGGDVSAPNGDFNLAGGVIGFIVDDATWNGTGAPTRLSYGIGELTAPKTGGVIAEAGGWDVTGCYWDKEATGVTDGIGDGSDDGTTGLTTFQMTGIRPIPEGDDTMPAFDFDNIWVEVQGGHEILNSGIVPEGDGYPILRSIPLEVQVTIPNLIDNPVEISGLVQLERSSTSSLSQLATSSNIVGIEEARLVVTNEHGQVVETNSGPVETFTDENGNYTLLAPTPSDIGNDYHIVNVVVRDDIDVAGYPLYAASSREVPNGDSNVQLDYLFREDEDVTAGVTVDGRDIAVAYQIDQTQRVDQCIGTIEQIGAIQASSAIDSSIRYDIVPTPTPTEDPFFGLWANHISSWTAVDMTNGTLSGAPSYSSAGSMIRDFKPDNEVGLLSAVDHVENVAVSETVVSGGSGALAYTANTVTRCWAKNVAVLASGDNVGGLVGNVSTSIKTSFVESPDVEGNRFVGGLVGHCGGRVEGCRGGDVDLAVPDDTNGSYMGGLAGEADEVYDSYAKDVEIGGVDDVDTWFFGLFGGMSIDDGTGYGGVVGKANDVVRCFSTLANITGAHRVGGVVGRAMNSIQECFEDSLYMFAYLSDAHDDDGEPDAQDAFVGNRKGSDTDNYYIGEAEMWAIRKTFLFFWGVASLDDPVAIGPQGGSAIKKSRADMKGTSAETTFGAFDFTNDWTVVATGETIQRTDAPDITPTQDDFPIPRKTLDTFDDSLYGSGETVTISGTVEVNYDGSTTPVENALVKTVSTVGGNLPGEDVRTDSNGEFSIEVPVALFADNSNLHPDDDEVQDLLTDSDTALLVNVDDNASTTLNSQPFYAATRRVITKDDSDGNVQFTFQNVTTGARVNGRDIAVSYEISESTPDTGWNTIGNVEQLQAINDTDLAADYRLIRSLAARETGTWNGKDGFVPIGDSTTRFTGDFDGFGFTIDALEVDRARGDLGLFGQIERSTISNLTLTNTFIRSSSGERVGTLVGKSVGGTIEQVNSTKGTAEGLTAVGGLVGHNTGTVDTGNVEVDVIGETEVGGVLGRNVTGTLTGVRMGGSVQGNGTTITSVGGIAGLNDRGTVEQASVAGSVSGAATEMGGIVGSNTGGTVLDTYLLPDIGNPDAEDVGGVVGYNDGDAAILTSYTVGNVTGNKNVGAVIGRNDSSDIGNTYWDGEAVVVTENGNTTGNAVGQGTGDGITELTTNEMQGVTPTPDGQNTMDGFDWENPDIWDPAIKSDSGGEPSEDGYPVLKAFSPIQQWEDQGITSN